MIERRKPDSGGRRLSKPDRRKSGGRRAEDSTDMKRSYILPHFAVTPAPAIPTTLTATAVSSSQVNLAWLASIGPNLKDYGVYRQGTGLLGYVTATSFSDTGLNASTSYTYYVTARNLALVESAPSNFASATTQSSGAFTPTPPFTVTGTPGNGNPLTVTRSVGTFAAKSYGAGAPQLFDTVAHQYVNGIDLNAYSGFADGTDIAHLVYGRQSKDNGVGTDVMKYYTSRSKRTSFDTANYATLAMGLGKGSIGFPKWPVAYGTQNNTRLYLSFWCRSKNAYSSVDNVGTAGDETNKWVRISDTSFNSTLQGGLNLWARNIQQWASHSSVSQSSFTGFQTLTGVWARVEALYDLTNGITNYWLNGKFITQAHSGINGGLPFEICKPADILFVAGNPTDVYWDPVPWGLPAVDAVCAGHMGYDDGHGLSATNDFDIAQVYVDPDFQRFEISDSSAWDVGTASVVNREIQGLWTRDSNTQCTVYQSQGQFASLSGKYLWYVTGRKTAEQVCRFT